ncbi:60S ribosomal protein L2, mitochondrial-like isoform X2 [Salvia hispanica]|uniref:60S ribosomal protein L2, mitochondrial-like isoform X2 n=1 Tax=Salvia hispanica TaxID=49212 RepID=UPI002008F80E|nr:60S ribosomal protein L2, mitochondrial-like isoform X2 [Salvia hispanica]
MAAARTLLRSAATSTRIASATQSASIFRSPVETSTSISPHLGQFGNLAGRNFSTKTRKFRFQRRIDMKRSTSATGIVERIEYDPNRTSRIALVRWEGGALQGKSKAAEDIALPAESLESTVAPPTGAFNFSSLPGLLDDRSSAYSSKGGNKQTAKSTYVMVGVPSSKSFFSEGSRSRITNGKDVIVSAFSTKAKGENADGFPRIAVAGSRPAYFVLGEKEEVGGKDAFSLGEVQKWKKDSARWMHRIKRKGAVSWSSLMGQEKLGTKGSKPRNGGKAKTGKIGDDRVPVTYIIASHQLGEGNLVMNWSGASSSSSSQYAQYVATGEQSWSESKDCVGFIVLCFFSWEY